MNRESGFSGLLFFILFVALFVCTAGYLVSPVIKAYSLEHAFYSGQSDEVVSSMDFRAIKQYNDANPPISFGAGKKLGRVEQSLRAVLTSLTTEQGTRDLVAQLPSFYGSHQAEVDTDYWFEDVDTFKIRGTYQGYSLVLTLELQGLFDWKVTSVEMG